MRYKLLLILLFIPLLVFGQDTTSFVGVIVPDTVFTGTIVPYIKSWPARMTDNYIDINDHTEFTLTQKINIEKVRHRADFADVDNISNTVGVDLC